MEADVKTLRQLVQESLYVVNERSVAEAILLRAQLRATIARPALHNQRELEAQPSHR